MINEVNVEFECDLCKKIYEEREEAAECNNECRKKCTHEKTIYQGINNLVHNYDTGNVTISELKSIQSRCIKCGKLLKKIHLKDFKEELKEIFNKHK